jgi:hypothetical protein
MKKLISISPIRRLLPAAETPSFFAGAANLLMGYIYIPTFPITAGTLFLPHGRLLANQLEGDDGDGYLL